MKTVIVCGVTDFYLANADLFDALSSSAWESLRPSLRAALDGIEPDGHPVLDIGAGTGLATEVIAAAVPAVDILAIEPSAALRPALMTRIMLVPGLRERVTVLPTDVAGAVLPERLGGAVAANMIGHLDPSQRGELLALVASRLVAGGVFVVGLQPPERPESVPHSLFGTVVVGRRSYEGWGGAEPTGPDTVRWRMVWRILENGEVLESRRAEVEWWTVREGELVDSLRSVGLSPRVGEGGFVVARKAG